MRDEGGILDVRLSSASFGYDDDLRPVELGPGSYVLLTVSDTGRGMDHATMARLFEPYFTTKKQGEGTGLGLAVVHGIVEAHGGAITVRSGLGQGTTFFVYLPRANDEMEPAHKKASQLPRGGERILLVDDEPGLLSAEQKMLELLGYRVTAVRDGAEAFELFRSRPEDIDLVITDQTMPGVSGLQLAKECMSIRADLPVILCTGFSETVTPEQAQAVGVREYLLKPLMLTDVAEAIRRVLN
jgi:CheY-like chemotaxis protein